MRDPARPLLTIKDLLARPEDERVELLHGVIVEKAAPSAEHGLAQAMLDREVGARFHRKAGSGGPGGWWILVETDVEFAPFEIYRPDLVGWRRDRVPERPSGRPVVVRPDWVCEVLSPSNRRTDTVDKAQVYHRVYVPHYWLVDPVEATLTVLRYEEEGYKVILTARRGDVVRAEPFDAIELRVGLLFGDDRDD